MGNEKTCKVSVIVPVYRVDGYIDRCIKSLLKQTLDEIEILCICEKEDNSYHKLRAYEKQDSRVLVIEKKNTGVSSARNAGIRAAKGEYIAFVDADDWIERYALKLLYLTAERYKAQIIAYGIWPTVEPGNDKRGIFDCTPVRNVLYHGNGMMALFYEHGSRPYVINKFYQTKFIHDHHILFDESIDIGEDQLLQFEAFDKADTICFVKDKFYHYEMGRKESAMNISERKKTLSDKNFQLLQVIMAQKRGRDDDKYDQAYVSWILQEYGGEVNQKSPHITKSTRDRIFAIQNYLRELSSEKYIGDLPVEYQHIWERFIYYQGSETASRYLRIPYREYDAYMERQIEGLYEKITVVQGCMRRLQRVYEVFAFHEFRHWIVTVPIRMVQRYKIYMARQKGKMNK